MNEVVKQDMIYTTDEIIKQLLESKSNEETSDEESLNLLHAFEKRPVEEKIAAEEQLIKLLNDTTQDSKHRAWITGILGRVGTKNAKDTLINRLFDDKEEYLVKRWAVGNLYEFFYDTQTASMLEKEFDSAVTISDKQLYASRLARSQSPFAVKKLIELLSSFDYAIRYHAAYGIYQNTLKKEALDVLLTRLDEETYDDIKILIILSLSEIKNQKAVLPLINLLRKDIFDSYDVHFRYNLHFAAINALIEIADPSNDEVVSALLEATCRSDPLLAVAATRGLGTFLKDEAIQKLVDFGLKDVEPEKTRCVATALRYLDGAAAIQYLTNIEGDDAEHLLMEIGTSYAVELIVDRRQQALKGFTKRVEQFDSVATSFFNKTIQDAEVAFNITIKMSRIVFWIGCGLLIVSVGLVLYPNASQLEQLYGAGGVLAGLGMILAMFYKTPVERIERAVTNLVQIEVGFMTYIRQISQVNGMFEREYMDDDFDLAKLKMMLEYSDTIMKETMESVNKYTLSENRDEKK